MSSEFDPNHVANAMADQSAELRARLAAAELHLFSGHGCDCRHMAEQRAAYLASTDRTSSEPK